MEHYLYYSPRMEILDIFPQTADQEFRNNLIRMWDEKIAREILIALSNARELTVMRLKEMIGHSMSTLHENIEKLEAAGLIESEIIYVGKKQKVIRPAVICVTKNPKHKENFKRFFQGLWVDSENFKQIVAFLRKNPDKYYTCEEISLRTKIPVDDVEILLNNWDSPITKSLSDFMKEAPFEKKLLYRARR